MAISFETAPNTIEAKSHYNKIALEQMRPLSRKYDELEGEVPTEWVDWWWETGRKGAPGRIGQEGDGFIQVCVQAEELCFGDAALYLRMPTPALGGSAVSAAGTKEQKVRFLSHFSAIQKYMRVIMIVSGLLLIAFGIILLTDNVSMLLSIAPDFGVEELITK